MCLQENGDWKKNCKIDPKEKNSERYIVCDSKEERFSPFNPLLDKKVWPVEAQNVRFGMRVCVCPNSRFSLPRLRSTYSGEPFFGAHIFWQNKNVSTSALVRPGGGQTYALVGRWIWSLGTLPTNNLDHFSRSWCGRRNCVSLKLGTTFVLLWTNGRFIGGNNAIQTYLSNEFHLPGANTWNAKTHVKRAKSVYD